MIVAVFVAVLAGVQTLLRATVQNQVQIADPSLKMTIGGVEMGLLRPGLTLSNVTIFRDGPRLVRMARAQVQLSGWRQAFKLLRAPPLVFEDLRLRLVEVDVNPTALDQKAQTIIRSLGLHQVEASLDLRVDLNQKQQMIFVRDFQLRARDLFRLHARAMVRGLNFDSKESMLKRAEVSQLEVNYEDRSLFGRSRILETFPEMRAIMAKPKNDKSDIKVVISDKTQKQAFELIKSFMLQPATFSLVQRPGASLKVDGFKENYLGQQVEVAELLENLQINMFFASKRYFEL
ncbi:MAG: hypothetical protein AB7N80_08965 [Bdellovibrionales bacterium]